MSGPSVGVVIPTRGDRPALLRAALAAVLAQRHPGRLEVVVVADGCDPRGAVRAARSRTSPRTAPRRVRVLANPGGPHLARARNTGIAALGTEWIAFCDDDDVWLPGKLAAQLAALRAEPGADFASCAIEVEYGGRRVPRLAGTDRIDPEHLVRSRMVMVHSSTFLFARLPGGRGRPRRPERGLGPRAARGEAAADRARGPAAGPGPLGPLALRHPLGGPHRRAGVDARPAPRARRRPPRRGPRLRPARLPPRGARPPPGRGALGRARARPPVGGAAGADRARGRRRPGLRRGSSSACCTPGGTASDGGLGAQGRRPGPGGSGSGRSR